tara:strand:- start:30 stop:266 length:237 start_codon:yes stop_codon:yes gene_type:complete
MQLLFEAILVGLMVVVIGSLVSYGLRYFSKKNLPSVCKDWNKYYVMEICLFITGFLVHIICELTRLNKWYCTKGNACK